MYIVAYPSIKSNIKIVILKYFILIIGSILILNFEIDLLENNLRRWIKKKYYNTMFGRKASPCLVLTVLVEKWQLAAICYIHNRRRYNIMCMEIKCTHIDYGLSL